MPNNGNGHLLVFWKTPICLTPIDFSGNKASVAIPTRCLAAPLEVKMYLKIWSLIFKKESWISSNHMTPRAGVLRTTSNFTRLEIKPGELATQLLSCVAVHCFISKMAAFHWMVRVYLFINYSVSYKLCKALWDLWLQEARKMSSLPKSVRGATYTSSMPIYPHSQQSLSRRSSWTLWWILTLIESLSSLRWGN